ncbi:creatininase family protein [Alkalicoccus urumqiensis]|uniref:Creatininase n=1 Tax=Alkalicoccus urumqiensis TaxID=1548213 RepID=A0A2P6MJI7_ALKUR|nr:creatininase family protein [Alkalicoccus urumqiensis]PRO66430.1 creatininase [Alkalicoccus urumqiensis]
MYDHHEAWSGRFLPALTTRNIEALDKTNAAVVLPVCAVEQHGPHLPVYTDTMIAEGLLQKASAVLSADTDVWFLPPLAYGKSTEHLGHSGTMTLTAETLQHVVMDLARSVKESGFSRLILFNSHGGNNDLLNMMGREIRIDTGLDVFRVNAMDGRAALEGLISEDELRLGIHGGEVETSLILALESRWVDMEKAPSETYTPHAVIDIKGSPAAAWTADDLTACGTSGDAARATKETGGIILERLGGELAGVFAEMSTFHVKQTKPKEEALS